jgi:hypothetical protein
MKNMPLLAYLFCIIIGAVMIVFPGGIVICLACGPWWMTVLGAISVVIGVVGLANRAQGG